MPHPSDRIAALIGSRICHDLVSPVGAIGNGLELMEMTGQSPTPELSLVAASAADVAARIRLFRLAFGDAGAGQRVDGGEVAGILDTVHGADRVKVAWQATGEHPRPQVKAVLLALLCAETALAGCGRITVTRTGGRWRVRASGERLRADPALWALLDDAAPPENVAPAAVQFLLLPGACRDADMKCAIQHAETEIEISL